MTPFAFNTGPKDRIFIAEGIPSPDPINRRKYRNARCSHGPGKMHNARVIAQI
jgi:hypothetical protein